MFARLKQFIRTRRSAIALVFAFSAFPLTALVAMSIDYAFYCQARSQFTLAADAAATLAVREANSAYVSYIDTNSTASETPAQAAAIQTAAETAAQTEGENAGCYWFVAQLATLPRVSITNPNATNNVSCANPSASGQTPSVLVGPGATGTNVSFTATVTYKGLYPPFFDSLFSSTNNWTITGTSGAAVNGGYEEFLIMMDTSGSMLIGANPPDVTTMDDNTVCMLTTDFQNSKQVISWPPFGAEYLDPTSPMPNYYGGDYRDWVNFQKVAHYKPAANDPSLDPMTAPPNPMPATTEPSGSCGTPSKENNYSNKLDAPCAFACHTTNTVSSATGQTEDLYGLARYLYLTSPSYKPQTPGSGSPVLRIDAVFSAVETVISNLEAEEQQAGQFTVGVYQFNDDVSSIVNGNTGNGDVNDEATSNLTGALTAVDADDWMKTPTETAVPIIAQVDPQNTNLPDTDYTDFATSLEGLATTPIALTAGGNGTTPQTPQKYLFIVTDGMNDTSPISSGGRLAGGITGICAELTGSCTAAGSTTTGVCYYLKNTLKFTIYVLAITYDPVPDIGYYDWYAGERTNNYIAQDFPNLVNTTTTGTALNWTDNFGNIENLSEGDNLNNKQNSYDYGTAAPTLSVSPAPVIQALDACASTNPTTGLPDVVSATTASDINTQMSNILESALDSSVHSTQ
jgi:Flp pilus assembly protein TadG